MARIPLDHRTHRVLRSCLLVAGTLLAAALTGCERRLAEPQDFPRRPIKLIVPFAAGGGSDTFGRIIQSAIEENQLLPEPLVIINVPGAGGTIGSRRVKNARPDGYTLLLLHDGILTARHCGSVSYGPEVFAAIAGTGNAGQVIAVGASSRHHDLTSLMNAAARDPDSILFSANIGAPSHFAGLMLQAERPGASFRYTQNGGGAKRFAALQGGHADVTAFSIAEFVQFQSSGIRALGLLGPVRHPEFPELATAREQGFDVISENMQFWWAPAGTPPERIEQIADALTAAMKTNQVRDKLAEMKISDVVLRGEPLEKDLQQRQRRIAAVAPAATARLPDFTTFAILLVVMTGFVALIQSFRRRRDSASRIQNVAPVSPHISPRLKQLSVISFVTIVYVALMQMERIGFVPATALYSMSIGTTLVSPSIIDKRITMAKAVASLVLVAGTMSVVIHYLFTQILVVDLP
ncbi:MAG: tripartite tricarboxylate transporter TctB family protein [Planctomycetales bacterium]|nr:tripartite tricarboxylate transporter TctB family protein [Planctomycetales bacterium]